MPDWLIEYILFFAEMLTVAIFICVIVGFIIAMGTKNRHDAEKGQLKVSKLNDIFQSYRNILHNEILESAERKKLDRIHKREEKTKKKEKKQEPSQRKKRIYVIRFKGDVVASAVNFFREEISAVLSVAEKQDEVVIKLESGGGEVSGYGLAASQLERVRNHGIPLTICIDRVAASGGYLMACIGNKILAAPFAVVGSIGVVAQLPNFNRLLKKHNIDYEMLTAGEYKRTLSLFGENTEQGRTKMQADIEQIHYLFKNFIALYRTQVDIATVCTGEFWFGRDAITHQLVDELITSDEYLWQQRDDVDIYTVSYTEKKKLMAKFQHAVENSLHQIKRLL